MDVINQPNFDLLNNLRSFLAGATRSNQRCDLELTKCALNLLKSLPASRDAVLEYFFIVFDKAVNKYASQVKNDQLMNSPVPISKQEEEVMNEIHGVVCAFVSANPKAWAPIISSWSLQVLGKLSSRYSVHPTAGGLNETLHWWMSCQAAKTLIDVTTQCLHCLIETDTEACVSALLETSFTHSPHFDWVVALVGSCFSKTVITRVLSLGLKDFCIKGTSPSGTKLKSVVGILGHLGANHFTDIRSALLELFVWALNVDGKDEWQKAAVVPYLLQLAAQSQTLLNAMTSDVLHKLDVSTLVTMTDAFAPWFAEQSDTTQFEDLTVSLILRSDKGAAKIISLLLEGAASNRKDIALTCQVLIELLIDEIEKQLQLSRNTPVQFLEALKSEIGQVQPQLLTEDPMRQRILVRLLRLLETVNQNVAIESACYLLQLGSNVTHMSTLMLLVVPNLGGCQNLLASALELALRRHPSAAMWSNVGTLLKHENNKKFLSDGVVAKAVTQNLAALSTAIPSSSMVQQGLMVELLQLLPSSCLTGLTLQLCLRLTSNIVSYLFSCIKEKEGTNKVIQCRRVGSVLERLSCESAAARASALRQLLETSLFQSGAHLFGSRRRPIQRLKDTPYSLTEENYKLRTRSMITGRLSSIFGNSVVLNSSLATTGPTCPADVETNMLYLIDALRSCCTVASTLKPGERILSLDASIQVALLLVELISPDVMYNGLPWPDEDFCKVTIERDIHIRKVFDDVPVAWWLLEMLARQQPALCYCSVLLRALMASLISQWSSPSTSSQPAVLQTTVRLLRLMCLGLLLPPPLTSLPEIVSLITPQEVLALLRSCVWNYMKDHVPSPALFSADPRTGFMWRDIAGARPPLCYTEPIRLVLLNNIQHFGTLYLNLFVHT